VRQLEIKVLMIHNYNLDAVTLDFTLLLLW